MILRPSSIPSPPSTPSSEYHEALAATAAERGLFGARFHYLDEAGSTNDLALHAAERGEPEGTVFVAGAQTNGRGRLGRTWISLPGAGLYVSTIVRRAALAPWIALAGGVAVAEGIREATGLPVQIKWPNDVVAVDDGRFSARRKLAGVLAEAATSAGEVQHIVLGFGINVRPSALPPDVADRATSIETELGRPVDAGAVLARTLVALNRATALVTNEGSPALLERWIALSPSANGARVEWDGPGGGSLSGVTAGLAPDGGLRVRTAVGIHHILSGDVRWP